MMEGYSEEVKYGKMSTGGPKEDYRAYFVHKVIAGTAWGT